MARGIENTSLISLDDLLNFVTVFNVSLSYILWVEVSDKDTIDTKIKNRNFVWSPFILRVLSWDIFTNFLHGMLPKLPFYTNSFTPFLVI